MKPKKAKITMKILRISVLGLCVAALLSGLGLYFLSDFLPHSPPLSASQRVRLGTSTFIIPQAFLRGDHSAGNSGGSTTLQTQSLELAVFYPSFAPAGAPTDITATTDLALRHKSLIVITLTPNNGELDPAERVVKLYARFLEQKAAVTDGGLIVRHFLTESPYKNQTLYYSPPEGRQFAARCEEAPALGSAEFGAVGKKSANTSDSKIALCHVSLRHTIQNLGTFDITLRFEPNLLDHWLDMMEKTDKLIAQFGGRGS